MRLSYGTFIGSRWRMIAVVVGIILLAGYFFIGRGDGVGATLTITQSDFREQVRVSGTVVATQDVALGFAANGRISGTYARVGQHVSAGTILAEIENGDLLAALSQKQSALTQAEANLASLKIGTRPEELAVAQTTVTNAEATLINALQSAYTASDDAVRNKVDPLFTNPRTSPKLSFAVGNMNLATLVEHDRELVESVLADWSLLMSKLSSTNAASSAEQAYAYLAQVITLLADANLALNQGIPDQTTSSATLSAYSTTLAAARTSVNTAATTLTASSAALTAAESALALKQAGSTRDALAAQEAVVAAAAADVRNVQAQLVKTRVIAPFSGTVTRMDAKTGEIVSPTTSQIGMQSDGIFEIETYVPEVAIARVTVGNRATTTLDAYGSSVTFPSQVVAVDPAETVKDGVPTYKTVLAFLSKDARIRSGMTADVVIETGVLHDAIVIPSGSIGTKEGMRYVSVVEKGQVVNRPITTGPAPALGQAEILSGLSAGEVILLTPVP